MYVLGEVSTHLKMSRHLWGARVWGALVCIVETGWDQGIGHHINKYAPMICPS
jgi:hypothetical protein